MESPWYSLMTNAAVVAFYISVWTQIRDVIDRLGPRAVEAAFGIAMGLGAITTMLFPVQFAPGVLFDLRTCMVALAAFFGGPVAGLITAAMTGGYRLWVGGAGAPAGLVVIGVVTLLATLGHMAVHRNGGRIRRWHSVALAIMTCAVGLALVIYTSLGVGFNLWPELAAARTLLLFAAIVLAGLALTHEEELRLARRENQTYRSIIDTLPDSISVRDLEDRFVVANPATAKLLGVDSPHELIGRARSEFAAPSPAPERHGDLTAIGQSDAAEFQQVMPGPEGATTWLQTLETDLRDDRGRHIGRIAHNRDITARKRLELELDERQRVLSFAMAQMSDGVAMFDRDGRLLFCNAQYQQLFPLTSDVRVPGAHIRTILAAAVARREQQVGADAANIAKWIDDIADSLHQDSEEEVHLFDGTWLRVSTRPSPDGVSMVVVSDITRLKRTELELLNVTEQLRQEATTDALTGLVNRRALDQRLEIEIARSLRTDGAISVILLDIDHFKAYNDTYGHLAGDACLKVVSNCLGQVFRRPTDLVARYGGEEFMVVLPDVDADAAYQLATEYRGVLKGMSMPHKASPFQHVTVSIGIATYAPGETERSAGELVGRADEALYAAKTAGRDRVNGWRRRFSVSPRQLRVVT